jgi:hypothetical protein
VLEELAEMDDLTADDRALARARIRSVALACQQDQAVQVGIERKHCVLTTNSLVRPPEGYLPDLPAQIRAQLQPHLQIAEVDDATITNFYRLLEVQSLRQAVTLDPQAGPTTARGRWQHELREHARNLGRYLIHAVPDLDHEVLRTWPPEVEQVETLEVVAKLAGRELVRWPAEAFLVVRGRTPRLLVRGENGSLRHLVDAIIAHFGLQVTSRRLLVAILQAPSEQDGARELDDDEIPPLPPAIMPERQVVEINDLTPPDEEEELVEDPVGDAGLVPSSPVESPIPGGTPGSTETRPNRHADGLGLQPARVATDYKGLEARGYTVVDEAQAPVTDQDAAEEAGADTATPDRVVLSYVHVCRGLLPIKRHHANRLAGGDSVTEVLLFGERHVAKQLDDGHVWVQRGAELFAERDIVPGTIVYLHPGPKSRIELEVREHEHDVHDVWTLEIDEDGRLQRTRTDAVRVRYETDGPLYRSERRWEDLAALHVEATSSGLDLVIRAFDDFGDNGLTAEETWQAVALHRLLAMSTIRGHLSSQKGLFELRGGRYFKTGVTVTRHTGTGRSRAKPSAPPGIDHEARRLAKGLARLLGRLEPSFRYEIAAILGFTVNDE